MRVTLEGEEELYKELTNKDNYIPPKFWNNVKKDALSNLQKTARPHNVTGKLQRNLFSKTIDKGIEMGVNNEGMMVGMGGTRVNYAVFVEYGTKPHKIRAKKKKSLRWVSGTGFMFAKEVNHPGYKGSHFLQRAADKTYNNLERIWNRS